MKKINTYLVNGEKKTKQEIIEMSRKYGYTGNTLNIAAYTLRNKGFVIKYNVVKIVDLIQDDIGKWVTYRSYGGDKVEYGKIKSWNDRFVFVVYNANNNWDGDNWKNYTGAATNPEDLEWGRG